jgi:hypothetical protein
MFFPHLMTNTIRARDEVKIPGMAFNLPLQKSVANLFQITNYRRRALLLRYDDNAELQLIHFFF